ncbi:CDP-glucose 4,6-dehydratase [compost metagenome]
MCSVGEVVASLAGQWPQAPGVHTEPGTMHEAGLLRLDSSRARQLLGWQPRWSLKECLQQTLGWHMAWQANQDMREITLQQLNLYKDRS